ncbi:MAG: hypothetical protein FWH20_00845 [Oscillospiraceae bacterium]|nr:hypothetical protein [Oscillospiraceae bacterium]
MSTVSIMTRIYIIKADFSSITEKSERKTYKKHIKITEKFNARLKKHKYRVLYIGESDFPESGYAAIRQRIASCKCVLAFTDGKTFETNHRTEELTHAIMDAGIQVFLYTALDSNYEKSAWLGGLIDLPHVHVLPADVKGAVKLIDNILQ